MNSTALVVDDEADLCKLMQMTLTKMGIRTDVAYSLEMAYELFNNNNYDFCLTDLNLPDGSGIDLVKKVVSCGKNTPIAVITAHGTVDVAIEAMKLGAFDFVNKPLELSRLRQLATNALKVVQGIDTNNDAETTARLSPEDNMLNERLIGVSSPMTTLRNTIKKVARSQAPVFLWGASGTGKEVVARLIHDLSPRREGSFVPVNCGAIPSELMESEFFGHKKGSFTGATTDKIGLFQQANGGTLFLDEVADLPLAMQVKLLRAIQEKTVRAIGDTKEIPVDVRILSATHKDLNKLVQSGAFRQDLFYRINVIMVKLPALNDRREDIELLANHFLQLIAKDWSIDVPVLTNEAMQTLKNHDFEGNVRELRNLLERAVTMSDGNEIATQHLFANTELLKTTSAISSPYQDNRSNYPANVSMASSIQPIAPSGVKVQMSYSSSPPPTPTAKSTPSTLVIEEDLPDNSDTSTSQSTSVISSMFQFDKLTVKKEEPSFSPEHSERPLATLPKEGLEQYLLNQEKALIIAALAQAGNNKTNAAKLLGMSFRSLRYRMKKLEIDEHGGQE